MNDAPPDEPGAQVWLDRGGRRYAPGEELTGGYRVGDWRDEPLTAVELSILWYTSGQGEEDLYVHHFERRREPSMPSRAEETPYEFAVRLPESPLSYDGVIVKVCWAVRVRGCFRSGRTRLVELPFWLSNHHA
ncbi:hypothetical protein [Botrimarina sp.]|uniref:hypothetical protein n=1 Tax=Botrimarina sp. TaxID=2795802 RepID=UPI0032EC1CB0